MMYLLALLIGMIAGMRTMTAPAAVSWAAASGLLALEGSALAFLGWRFTPWILTLLAIGELITDKLPATPSRKVPVQFGARIVSGALAGGAIGASADMLLIGAGLGIIGAVIGTLGGSAARSALARGLGRDLPAAIIEDVVAVCGAALIVLTL